MKLPDYWLSCPDMNLDHQTQADFDRLLTQVKSSGTNTLIEYTLPHPKWQFLCYVADRHGIALHGTGDPNICLFEPRQPLDLGDFSNQKAVYAAGDGLWAIFFAVVDRNRYPLSVNNACIRLVDGSGKVSEPLYVFSISQTILPQRPWRNGVVYLLPPDTFVTQPVLSFGPTRFAYPSWPAWWQLYLWHGWKLHPMISLF